MSFLTSIENEISSIAASAKSTVEKLEAFVGLHQRVQELTDLKSQVIAVVNDVTKAADAKAEAILELFDKS